MYSLELIPDWLAWLVWIMPLTYGVRILLIGEFGGDRCDNVRTPPEVPTSCESIIANSGAKEDDTWWYYLVLLLLFVIFRLAALVILRKKANKFY